MSFFGNQDSVGLRRNQGPSIKNPCGWPEIGPWINSFWQARKEGGTTFAVQKEKCRQSPGCQACHKDLLRFFACPMAPPVEAIDGGAVVCEGTIKGKGNQQYLLADQYERPFETSPNNIHLKRWTPMEKIDNLKIDLTLREGVLLDRHPRRRFGQKQT